MLIAASHVPLLTTTNFYKVFCSSEFIILRCFCGHLQFLANKFQPDPKTSASVLGLYGMGGLGKTTISKSLCNHFNREFLGRVCYIEIKEGMDALERQRIVMRKLLRPDESILQNICDASQVKRLLSL